MTIYRRRAASSPFALRKSLERRAQGLRVVIAQRAYDDTVLDLDDATELEDLLNTKLTSALPDDPAEAAAELLQVEALIEKIDALGALDTKRDLAVELAKQLTADGRSVLIFTGYADTMYYLRDALIAAYGDAIGSYSGNGGAIRGPGRMRVLVCTDAASEGLNLQAAGALMNYDLPWNPSKVEQRIGRIDRIGQVLPVLPIINLYLKDSVDRKVYRALANRCGLFETFVGPMQPVLSRALRMLLGRAAFDEDDLSREAERLQNDPTIMHVFPDADPSDITQDSPLVSAADTETLLNALDGTGLDVHADTNGLYVIAGGPLRIAADPAAVLDDPEAACVDGLDQRQWALLSQLQRPGERLPLVCAASEQGAFRALLCAWIDHEGASEIRSLAALHARLDNWDGEAPKAAVWQAAAETLRERARVLVAQSAERARREREAMIAHQHEAVRLRLIEELGRFLICFQPDTSDLNGKCYRLASDHTATAGRLREVLQRLRGYPDWPDHHIADLRSFRDGLSANQIKSRLIGRELEAALADPRWLVGQPAPPGRVDQADYSDNRDRQDTIIAA
jgi:Helicase conserved C-terminal domain